MPSHECGEAPRLIGKSQCPRSPFRIEKGRISAPSRDHPGTAVERFWRGASAATGIVESHPNLGPCQSSGGCYARLVDSACRHLGAGYRCPENGILRKVRDLMSSYPTLNQRRRERIEQPPYQGRKFMLGGRRTKIGRLGSTSKLLDASHGSAWKCSVSTGGNWRKHTQPRRERAAHN